MADQSGLRFDIYERIHLPDDAVGIQELEEIELTPHIQVQRGNDQSVLKGSLRLSGRYIGIDAPGSSKVLQYEIPVEISLPANRGMDMRAVGSEIENFDIDVISERSLNVTGVLSLHGLNLENKDQSESESDEEMIFVHHVSDFSGAQNIRDSSEAETEEEEIEPQNAANLEQQWMAEFPPTPMAFEPEWKENKFVDHGTADKGQPNLQDPEQQIEADWQVNGLEADLGPFGKEIEEISREPQGPQEVKVAFSGKNMSDEANEPVHLSSALNKSGRSATQQIEQELMQQSQRDVVQDEGTSPNQDALEWKKLFLNNEQKDQFRSVRMCIVQKEETVELIAERYQINPREIMLYNRLDDNSLMEGQVIYIPKSS